MTTSTRRILYRRGSAAAIVAAAVVVVSAAIASPVSAHPAPGAAPAGRDDQVAMNQIQVVGTHNSYHVENTDQEKSIRNAVKPGSGTGGEEFSHAPLYQQLDRQAVRQVELDLVNDPTGGRFTDPLVRHLAGEGDWHPDVMDKPGIKVLHEEGIDYQSNCLTFISCLTELKAWSDENPGAVPITIILEFKDGPGPEFGDYELAPLPTWTHARMLGAEREALSVFTRERIITPDDVRQPGMTLRQSVLQHGWPTLAVARGKVMFAGIDKRDMYLQGSDPSLRHRLFFTNAQNAVDAPDAAFVLGDDIEQLVAEGFMTKRRADTNTTEARSGDTTRRDAALASGAQLVSTDYPVPGMAARFGTGYYAAIPGGTVARCNPINAPKFCRSEGLDEAGDAARP